jgi:hypothetical protein
MDNHENQVVHLFTLILSIFGKDRAYDDLDQLGDGW